MRHTDFASVCQRHKWEPCFPPLEMYKKRVQEVKEVISKETGIIVDKVLVASDEKNQTWWEEVHSLGWKSLNHDNAAGWETYDAWYVSHLIPLAVLIFH